MPISQAALDALFKPVGQVILLWAQVEAAIVNVLAVVYQSAGGKHLNQGLPISFSKRVRFLRLCSGRIAALDPFAADLRTLLDKAKSIAELRHTIVHGAVTTFDPATGVYGFWMTDTNTADNFHHLRSVPMTLPELAAATQDCIRLGRDIHALMNKLMDAFVR